MDPRYFGLIEMAVSFGVVALLLGQQLWSLRDKKPPPTASPEDPPPES